MELLSIVCILIFLLLIILVFLWKYLFYRDAFITPVDSVNLKIGDIQGISFLIENNIPYPAGIQSTNRVLMSLDGNWDFHIDDDPEVRQVTVPSCFNTADSPLRDYQGTVWYERDFVMPAFDKGSLIRLTFLGSFYQSEVWLDGQPIGNHEGGYLPFYFDITENVVPGKVHHLKVSVDNRIGRSSLPPYLFQGHNLGWHPFGGLHRSVQIEICPPQYCFKLRADAKLDSAEGILQVSALFHRYKKDTPTLQNATLSLLTDDGHLLSEMDVPICWDSDGHYGAVARTLIVPSPVKWKPTTPYLYRFVIQTRYERCETTFGFRSIQAKDGKLLLNNKPLILKGICRHMEDREIGLAQQPDSVKNELETIQTLNAEFVRLAHYPHSTETLDLCDRLGLCAWVEIPLYQAGLGIIRYLFDKTKRDTGKTLRGLPGVLRSTNALENPILLGKARDELLKMIERDSNHPSVLFWGLGNECWTMHPSGARALTWLREQAEVLDKTRLISYAAFALPVLSPIFERAFDVVDVVAVNEYFGWYYGKVQKAGAFLSALARKYPHKPLMVTETGADSVRGRHTEEIPPLRGYSEEYQAWLLEEQWRQMRVVETFSGLSIWVLKDFLCPEYLEDNPVPFYNLKGLLDRDGQPKAAFEKVKTIYGNER
jgi:beta-glucuronidase